MTNKERDKMLHKQVMNYLVHSEWQKKWDEADRLIKRLEYQIKYN